MMYTKESIMAYTREESFGKKRAYIELGSEGNKFHKYEFVEAYTDLVVMSKLNDINITVEEYNRELVAKYIAFGSKQSFSFYISMSSEEQFLYTEVELELEVYLLDNGERLIFSKHLTKDKIGKQVAGIIQEFLSLVTCDRKIAYSLY